MAQHIWIQYRRYSGPCDGKFQGVRRWEDFDGSRHGLVLVVSALPFEVGENRKGTDKAQRLIEGSIAWRFKVPGTSPSACALLISICLTDRLQLAKFRMVIFALLAALLRRGDDSGDCADPDLDDSAASSLNRGLLSRSRFAVASWSFLDGLHVRFMGSSSAAAMRLRLSRSRYLIFDELCALNKVPSSGVSRPLGCTSTLSTPRRYFTFRHSN